MPAEDLREIQQILQSAVDSGTAEIVSIQDYQNVAHVTTTFNGTVYHYFGIVTAGVVTALLTPVELTAAVAGVAVALGVAGGALLYNTFPGVFNAIADTLDKAGKLIGDKVLSLIDFATGKTYIPESSLETIKNVFIDQGLYKKVIKGYEPVFEGINIDEIPVGQRVTVSDYIFQEISDEYLESSLSQSAIIFKNIAPYFDPTVNGVNAYTNADIMGNITNYFSNFLTISNIKDGIRIIENDLPDIVENKILISINARIVPGMSGTSEGVRYVTGIISYYYTTKLPHNISISNNYYYLNQPSYATNEVNNIFKTDSVANIGIESIDVFHLQYFIDEFGGVTYKTKSYQTGTGFTFYINKYSLEDFIEKILSNLSYQEPNSGNIYNSTLAWTFLDNLSNYLFNRQPVNFRSNKWFASNPNPFMPFSKMGTRIDTQDGAVLPNADDDIPDTYPTWKDNAKQVGEEFTYPITIQPEHSYDPEDDQDSAQTGTPIPPDEFPDPEVYEIGDDLLNPEPSEEDDPYAPDQPDEGDDPEAVPPPSPGDDPSSPPPDNPEDPNDGEGENEGTPIAPVLPTSDYGGGIASVFNPTEQEMQSLSNFLWGNSWTSLLAIFQNPLELIISFHRIFATPVTSSRQEIYFGTIPSGVSALTVPSRYITLDLGSVVIPPLYSNSIDYSPYSKASIYLPFIGFMELDIQDIMQSTVNCKYVIDVYTGDFTASLYITKNIRQKLNNHLSYSFDGNMAIQVPLYGSSILRTLAKAGISGLISTASGGVVSGMLSTASNALYSGVHYSKSGKLSSNLGATLQRNPFIEITSPLSYDANKYSTFYGYPSNKTVYLGNCKGFIRVKDVHLQIPKATAEEIEELENLLKSGIII